MTDTTQNGPHPEAEALPTPLAETSLAESRCQDLHRPDEVQGRGGKLAHRFGVVLDLRDATHCVGVACYRCGCRLCALQSLFQSRRHQMYLRRVNAREVVSALASYLIVSARKIRNFTRELVGAK